MEKAKFCKTNLQFIIFGITFCAFGVIFLKLIHPILIEHHVSRKIALKDGWSMRNTWTALPFPSEFHAYIFNVTNPDEILAGAKPVLKEFGPFVYDVWERKIKVEDHEEDDSLSYTLKRTYSFNAAKSNGLSDEDEFTLPQFMILGTANAVLRSMPTVLPLASKSIDSLFDKPKSLFVNVKIKKYLFEGYELDCVGVEEFFAKVVCNDVKEFWFKYRMEKIREDFYTTSCMGTFNDTVAWAGRTRVNRGIANITAIGKLVQFNDNIGNFAKWDDDKCDAFLDSTDGTMFRPFLTRKDHLYAANTVFSRRFDYRYDSDVVHNRLECYRFATSVGTDLETNPDDKCYCLAADRCLKNGVFELWKAMNWAMVASNPHFYLADPYYNDAVVGLEPNKEKHMSTIDVHPLTGSVVRASFRLQFNAPLTKQPKYRLLKNVSEAFLPVGWIEERFALSDDIIGQLKSIEGQIKMEKFFAISAIVIGSLIFVAGAGLEYKDRIKLRTPM